ncbi:transposase [Legionella israelensis]|uniref:transposase n=1 Tax=Legionella israelensis TaxID=454 RepID=UPI001F5EBEB1|nr:transposase [Legionella israelensis]
MPHSLPKKPWNLVLSCSFYPPYSPNLNPIERLWKVMNEKCKPPFFSASYN